MFRLNVSHYKLNRSGASFGMLSQLCSAQSWLCFLQQRGGFCSVALVYCSDGHHQVIACLEDVWAALTPVVLLLYATSEAHVAAEG